MDSKLVILSHTPVLGCEDPRCHLVYTQDEVESIDFFRFQSEHRYLDVPIKLHYLELKKLDPNKELYFNYFAGWTPRYNLGDNGFKCEKSINVAELFQGSKDYHINDKRMEIVNILKESNIQNKELIIYRTFRGWPPWDFLQIWSIGRYYEDKEQIRSDLFAKKTI